MWIAAKIGAQPYKGGKKGRDRGIDGYLHFRDGDKKPQFAVISVKGGDIKSGDLPWLRHTKSPEEIPGLRHFGSVGLIILRHTAHTAHAPAGHCGRPTFLLRPFGDHSFNMPSVGGGTAARSSSA